MSRSTWYSDDEADPETNPLYIDREPTYEHPKCSIAILPPQCAHVHLDGRRCQNETHGKWCLVHRRAEQS